jgi:MFS family permease
VNDMVERLSKPMLVVMTNIQKARTAVFIYFLLCGSAVTIWATHIPEVEKTLSLSTATIGIIILILGAGALASMQVLGALIDRYGSAKILVGINTALGAALFLPGFATNVWTLGVSIFILGACIGGTDIAMNAHALEVEKAYQRPIFSAFHAMWSIGGVVGAAVVGLALSQNLFMGFTMTGWGVLTIAVGFLLRPWLLESKARPTSGESNSKNNRVKELGFVIFVGLVSAAGAMIEGVGIDWSALYSVEAFQVTTATAAITVIIFSAAMALVRFFIDKVVAKFSRIFVIQMGSAVAGLGVAIALLSPTIELSWIGWALTGIGIAGVVPQCMAYGSEIGPIENQGRNLAKVVGLTYAGVLGGPAIIGFIGELIGLTQALWLGVALSGFIALSAIFMVKGKQSVG